MEVIEPYFKKVLSADIEHYLQLEEHAAARETGKSNICLLYSNLVGAKLVKFETDRNTINSLNIEK